MHFRHYVPYNQRNPNIVVLIPIHQKTDLHPKKNYNDSPLLDWFSLVWIFFIQSFTTSKTLKTGETYRRLPVACLAGVSLRFLADKKKSFENIYEIYMSIKSMNKNLLSAKYRSLFMDFHVNNGFYSKR